MDGMLMRRGGKASGAPAAGGFPVSNEINFYDYDGTLLYGMTINEVRQLTELPPGPDHTDEELSFMGWNWELADLQQLTVPMDVGALYDTTPHTFTYNGTSITKTSPIIIEVSVENASSSTSCCFDLTRTSENPEGNYYIDWCDAVTVESWNGISLNSTKLIGKPAPYYNNTRIKYKIYVMSDTPIKISFGDNFTYNKVYVHSVKCGANCSGIGYFYSNNSGQPYLTTCVLPKRDPFTLNGMAFNSCAALKAIVIPPSSVGCLSTNQSTGKALLNCNSLQKIVAPKNIGEISNQCLCSPHLKRLTLHGAVFNGNANMNSEEYRACSMQEVSLSNPSATVSGSYKFFFDVNPALKIYYESGTTLYSLVYQKLNAEAGNLVAYTPKS